MINGLPTSCERDKQMRTMWCALIIACGLPVAAAAQEAAVPLTLDEAIQQGLAQSKRLAELQAHVDASGFAVQGRRAADRPAVAAQGGYTRTNHVDAFAVPTTIGRPPQILYPDVPDNYRARLDLQWAIYTGGRTDALERAAEAERTASTEDLAAARGDLKLEITRSYWALVTAREASAVLDRSLQAIDAQVADLRSRLDQGLIPPNDVLASEAQRSHQRVLAVEAANQRDVAEADLKRLIGMDGDGRIEPTTPLVRPAPGEDAAPVAALIAQALKTRPERRSLEQRAESAEFRATAAGATKRPQVAVGAGYDYASPNPRIFPRSSEWNPSWDASVNVSWSLWDAGRRAAEQGEARATASALRFRVEDFDRNLSFEVRQRVLELKSSTAAVAAAEDGVRAAQESERVVGERFKAGVATATDVLDAQVARLQAELDRTRALAGVRLAEARLARARGL